MTAEAPPSHRATVDVQRWFRQELALAPILPAALGVAGVVAAVAGLTAQPAVAERVVAGLLGAAFLALAVGLAIWRWRFPPRALLVVDDGGLALQGRRARTELAWDDVTAIAVVRAPFRWRRTAARGFGAGVPARAPVPQFPRHYLRASLTAAARHRLADTGPAVADHGWFVVDLGVPPSTAREVVAALGTRLRPADIQRLDAREGGRIREA